MFDFFFYTIDMYDSTFVLNNEILVLKLINLRMLILCKSMNQFKTIIFSQK